MVLHQIFLAKGPRDRARLARHLFMAPLCIYPPFYWHYRQPLLTSAPVQNYASAPLAMPAFCIFAKPEMYQFLPLYRSTSTLLFVPQFTLLPPLQVLPELRVTHMLLKWRRSSALCLRYLHLLPYIIQRPLKQPFTFCLPTCSHNS